jgi:hypothetical protein
MKAITLILLFVSTLLSAQQVKYIPVKNDKNIIPVPSAELKEGMGESIYVIDGDESKGFVYMYFTGLGAESKGPATVSLILNSPDLEWSDTPDGYSVYSGETKLGSITGVGRNKSFEIPLDAKFFAGKASVNITLKANGNDGGYVQPNISGFGPVLKMVW